MFVPDAHNLTDRQPSLGKASDILRKTLGVERSDLIDFSGAACGLLLMLLCLKIEKDIREKQNERGK